MKKRFIESHRPLWHLNVMCRILKVSMQGYFCWRDGREPPRRSVDRALSVKIKAVDDQHRQVYGSPRIHRPLRSEGILVHRKRVERLIREAGIRVLPRRRFVQTTYTWPPSSTFSDVGWSAGPWTSTWIAPWCSGPWIWP